MYLRIEFPEFGIFNPTKKRNTGMVDMDNTGMDIDKIEKAIFR